MFGKVIEIISNKHKEMSTKLASLLCLSLVLLCSCNNKEDDNSSPYPSLITEFADLVTDEAGTALTFTNDKGTIYTLSNPQKGLIPSAIYRVVCGYEIKDFHNHVAQLYTIEAVKLLKEKNDIRCDELKVTSIWKEGEYINLNLTPRTQGGEQEWGFHIDNKETRNGINIFHLSLYHHQQDDPLSYSTTVYASLYLPNITDIQKGDSIYFTATTFEGDKKWSFAY